MVLIEKINEVHIKVHCDRSTAMNICDHFTFMVPDYKHMPLYKSGVWDGKIRLFNVNNHLLYCGLRENLEQFLTDSGEQFEHKSVFDSNNIAAIELDEFIKQLKLPFEKQRDYHTKSILQCLRNKRKLIISPTGSGKSAIIYVILRYIQQFFSKGKKILIIVPTTSLVKQMADDFKSYGYKEQCSVVYSGQDKINLQNVVISTWQTAYKMSNDWFKQFCCVFGDEAHMFKSKSLISIMEKCDNVEYKFGFTGSLNSSTTHQYVLEGLFGPQYTAAKTHKLIEQGDLSDIKIKSIVLYYSKHISAFFNDIKKINYQLEFDWLINYHPRNKFIANLAASLNGNVLLLFKNISHGQYLKDLLSNITQKTVYYIDGSVDVDTREQYRIDIENNDNCIILATYGTLSTGVNIPKIHNIIFASPTKSRIRNLQSIGRGLRKHNSKQFVTLYDIADNFNVKNRKCYSYKHLLERLKMYNSENFKYKSYNVSINNV